MAGNLKNTLTGGSMLPRGCLTPKARVLYDLTNGYSANGMGEASNSKNLSLLEKTEILTDRNNTAGI